MTALVFIYFLGVTFFSGGLIGSNAECVDERDVWPIPGIIIIALLWPIVVVAWIVMAIVDACN